MTPTAVLIFLPITHNTMNITTITNVTPSSTTSHTTVSSNFGVYQHTPIGSISISIRTLVPDVISVEPYRKALIATLLSHQSMNISDTPSVSFSDRMSTVASSLGLNTGSAEREAETAGIDIRNALFLFLIYRASVFLTFPVHPLRSLILLVVLQTLLTLIFVLSFRLPQSITALQHHLYSLNFLSA